MTDLYGLNPYHSNSVKDQWAFSNWRWVLNGRVARCAQPNYNNTDQPHTLRIIDVAHLNGMGVGCVISVNHCNMSDEGKANLATGGIAFHHFPVVDFQPPTPEQLKAAAGIIETTRLRGRAALVYCGAGKGRTGTFIAGWAMAQYIKKVDRNAPIGDLCSYDFLHANFHVENDAQARAVNTAATGRTFGAVPPPVLGLSGLAPPIPGMTVANFGGGGGSGASFAPPMVGGSSGSTTLSSSSSSSSFVSDPEF